MRVFLMERSPRCDGLPLSCQFTLYFISHFPLLTLELSVVKRCSIFKTTYVDNSHMLRISGHDISRVIDNLLPPFAKSLCDTKYVK